MLLGGMGGVMAKSFYQDDVIFPYVTIAIADGLFGFVYYVFMFLIRGRYDVATYVTSIILPEVLYTLVASLILLPILHRYNIFLDKLVLIKEKESDV
jgi:rod shape-determining protein MreD